MQHTLEQPPGRIPKRELAANTKMERKQKLQSIESAFGFAAIPAMHSHRSGAKARRPGEEGAATSMQPTEIPHLAVSLKAVHR